MSANTDAISKQEGLDSGMDFFLFKPFSYKVLLQVMKNADATPSA